jgi:DNA polymerase-1
MTPYEFDMALTRPVFAMMRRGFRIDREKQAKFHDEYHEKWGHSQALLDEVVGRAINVSSPKQIHHLLYKEFKLPPRKKQGKVTADEDAIRAMMANAEEAMRKNKKPGHDHWLRIFLSLKLIIRNRGLRKAIGSYIDIDLDEDDHARSTITIGGTETMRFSHSKTLWDTGLNLATVTKDLRSMYIADEGYELAEFDLNRGESWVYSFLSMDPELLRIHTSGGDFHSETASAIQGAFGSVGLSVAEIKRLAKAGDPFGFKLRYLGKKVNHASAYRMGPFRGAEVVNEEADETNITITPAQMKTAQNLWRGKYFGIRGWWDGIDYQLENTRTLTTPYGRVRQFFGFMSDSLKKEATATVPQSTSVDYINRGMLRVYDELDAKGAYGLQLLHQNHDSIVVQYPIQYRDEVIPEIIERLTRESVRINGHDVIIPVEGSYGPNWKELTEWEA